MATDRDPTFEGKQTEHPVTYSSSRVEPRPGVGTHPEKHSGSGLGTILTSSLLALIVGGAGAWAYVDYLHPMLEKKQSPSNQADAPKAESDSAARLNAFDGKLDELRSRVDQLPKPVTPQELEPLKERLALLDDVSRKVDALSARVNSLPAKIDQDSHKITSLTADLEGVRNEVASLRNNVQSSSEKSSAKSGKPLDQGDKLARSGASEAPREISPPESSMLQAGVEFFQKRNYDEASDFFANLIKTQPDDARVWYYAALSRGLATRDWKGETERLVSQGVNREKAGKPAKSQIDAAFTDLTTQTGKDWLAFYRRRAG
jgi:TolA-binding protein